MHSCVNCRFCGISEGHYKYPNVDEPIQSNSEFMTIASIGALVEGWTLVAPKSHFFSMRDLYAKPLFLDAVNSILPSLRSKYGNSFIAFEHGANNDDSLTACGTSHAHLHIVPFDSISSHFEKDNLGWHECPPSEVSTIAKGSEYLYYVDLTSPKKWEDPQGLIHILEQPTSQYFRQIIADICGKTKFADYKKHPFLDTAAKTRLKLSSE